MIAKVSGLAKVGLSVVAGLLGLTVLMTVLAAAGSEAGRDGESPAGYRELLGASSVTTVTVEAYPISIRVNGFTSTITATLLNEFQQVVTDEDGITVTFRTDLGVLGSQMVTKTTTTGVATAELESGAQGGIARIVATIDSQFGMTEVGFSYGTPTTVTVGANPTSIVANGVSTSTITATVKDELGYLIVDGTVVTFTTSLGVISPATDTTSNGDAF
ncbi:MAG: Ig-like domain-containing protein, partial [Anaerolineae bacterium]